ncbi:PREDICTED: uncharacterized protein LOC105556056 [Vollenhovia emeryi]|uniref:uncharacterized protein LOC105556056 n=1 Tax=Vollenhovia emeryi TaxID=411798 RepID=UPI0005F3A565|nr:PREDICTED: uncharacterized protein LOC105556056 [Vollenhovia emeryi]
MILHAAPPQLLASALVHIRDRKHNLVECRALLDTCSTANFISESILKQLDAHILEHSSPVGTINDTSTESRGMVRITIQSIHDNFRRDLTCLVIPTIADLIPSEMFPRDTIKIPSNIRLADPKFHLPRAVDLLIGSGLTLSLFSIGQINLSHEEHDLYLQKTRLGWVVVGGASSQVPSKPACYLTRLESQLSKFWSVEEVRENRVSSAEHIECEAHFERTVFRDNSGRYKVRLPFRESNARLGESRSVAFKRLLALERKLKSNVTLGLEYARVIEEYLTLNHMSSVEPPEDDGYYMPHHAVIKESSNTTKVRVVFDASAKTNNGMSLNDALMIGPTIQDTLFSHLIRFRTYNYVITADIEKMYRQVLLHEDDRRYQRFLWRVGNEVKTFQLNTLTFGVAPSSFLAIRVLHKLAEDERCVYPRAAQVITKHLYMDDLLTGADTIADARAIRDETIALLERGGFSIRQWASNDTRVIDDLSSNALHANFVFNVDPAVKTLGITWNTRDDKMYYSVRPIKVTQKLTKRKILSEIAKIFDPIGLLGPIILHAKRLMQDIWRSGLHWDESVPQAIYTEWMEFVRQLESVNQFTFERKLLASNCRDIQFHGFCDASSVGYGACLYIRSSEGHENTVVRLVCAKSRVAPLKPVTIPRLELCGALLLTQLYREMSAALNFAPNKVIFWCDSTIVLHWIKTPPHLLKTFVANRVVEIRDNAESNEWRHVRTNDNPADALSRGQLPHAFVQNEMWLTGPPWLIKGESEWPDEIIPAVEITELKKNVCLITTTYDVEILNRYSSYSKLLRVVAYCLRFRRITIGAKALSAGSQFVNELKELRLKGSISKGKVVNPFLDDDGLIRVGGRLQRSNLTFNQKHPILLPSRHRLTDNIIREVHEAHHHTGIQTTLSIIRQRFWLLDGRNQVRKIVRTCARCSRFSANAIEYKMGNLPSARVREAMPFANTGADFCGPFYVKEKKYRNRGRVKVYVCVFVCMAIKAIHLEIVSDLTTDGFLAALRRFIARRGLPERVYSDNGTNFVGANRQLKELYVLLNSEEHKTRVNRFACEHRITWHFIPPAAPHFGGLWESSVKLFKHHFKRVVGESLFTFEELNTFVIEVEGILNSRPITCLSSDPNDLLALTPAHYLIGKPLTTLPEGDLSDVSANRLSTWQHITKVRQDFWARWNLEYLNELQMRHKWAKDGPRLDVGTIVLVKDKNLPCGRWTMGRILELHPGKDGTTRAVTIKTATGEMKRSANILCPLPIEQ